MVLEAEIYRRLKNFELNLSFTAGKGCLGILGASGCGKSMTLKTIAGIIHPDRGRIALSAVDEEEAGGREKTCVLFDKEKKICLPPQRRRVGYLFQNYALFPNMTVAENILVGLEGRDAKAGNTPVRLDERRYNKEDKRRRLSQLVEQFCLQGLEGRYPAQLSGGQQQRTALARILGYEPEVLLLDEPFSAMDAFLREGLRLELSRVLQNFSGISLLVTHDRDEAYMLCSHLLLMDQGKILVSGKTREIFKNPGSCQAARLTGCKNISRIFRLGKHRVRALDWDGLELTTEQEVEEKHCAVGIRAHDLTGLSDAQARDWEGNLRGNLIPAGKLSISEMPFTWQITLENGLWWKKEKTIHTHDTAGIIPSWLRVDPSAVLLLEDEVQQPPKR